MHVRSAEGDAAQGGGFELSLIRLYFRLAEAAEVGEVALSVHPCTGIVKLSIGEEGVVVIDGMANGAVAPVRVFKDGQAPDRRGGERLLIAAILVLIKGRVTAQQGSFEAGQGLLDEAQGDGSGPESLGKLRLIGWVTANLPDKHVMSLIHLDRVGNGKGRLRLESGSTAIP